MTGFKRHMAPVVRLAGLPADVTAHVLRHTFASVAADIGLSLPTIAALIGHRMGGMTARSTHFADAVLVAAADRVAAAVARKLAGEGAADLVERPGAQRIGG